MSPDPTPARPRPPPASEASGPTDALETGLEGPASGIGAIRRSLGFGAAEEQALRGAARALAPCFAAWVDDFYTHLLGDPVAMRLLDDDGRVVRLKRSLEAWLHELFTLPFDERYEHARQAIGTTHVRIGMPAFLMVTAMDQLRRRVRPDVDRVVAPAQRAAVHRAVELALDMELALMIEAYRRSERAMARRRDRAVYAERAARRMALTLMDRAEAALCYVELAAARPGQAAGALVKLRDLLGGIARLDRRLSARARFPLQRVAPVVVRDLLAQALANVSTDPSTPVSVAVEPADLCVTLQADAVQLAVEELVQNAATHAAGGRIEVRCRRDGPTLVCEVLDEGPGWPAGIKAFQDIFALGSGLGLSFCELVAELHDGRIELLRREEGGAGVRLLLRELAAPTDAAADDAGRGPGRRPGVGPLHETVG